MWAKGYICIEESTQARGRLKFYTFFLSLFNFECVKLIDQSNYVNINKPILLVVDGSVNS